MSDNKNLDDFMKSFDITPDEAAKQNAKALFLQKAEEVNQMKTKKSKFGSWKSKQSLISFATGMAAMLILVVGVISGINPSFLTGTITGNNDIVRYRMFPKKVKTTDIDLSERYIGELSILYDPVTYKGFIDRFTKCDGKKLKIYDNTYLLSILRGEYGLGNNGSDFGIPDYSGQPIARYFDYYINLSGNYPIESDRDNGSIKEGIKYIRDDDSDILNFYRCEIYTAEILLLRVSDNKKLNGLYLPCEGQTLKSYDYPVLASILSPYRDYFKLPDLRGKSPINGAGYYISTIGLLPYTDQLPYDKVICRNCGKDTWSWVYFNYCFECNQLFDQPEPKPKPKTETESK